MFTVIAVRTMAGSYVQLIILMRNFGKFQSGILVLIICQRHIAICFSHGLRFHCLHIISNTCIFWVNIVPTSGSTNCLKIPSQNKNFVQQRNRKKLRRPGVEPRSSARASNSLTTELLCLLVFGEVSLFFKNHFSLP